MKVSHDFTIVEQDIIITALKEYSKDLMERGNASRAAVAELLINCFAL